MNNVKVGVVEDKDFLKSLKVIEDEFLFKGRLSQEEQDALLMCNDELEFFQIISKALAQEFFDFTIAKNKRSQTWKDSYSYLCGT